MSTPRSFQVYAFLRHMLSASKRTSRTLFIEAFILGALAAAPAAALGHIIPAGGIFGFFLFTAIIRVFTINKGDRTRIEASTRTPTTLIGLFAGLALLTIPGLWIASGFHPEPLEPSPELVNAFIPLLKNNIPLVVTSTVPFIFNILYWVWLKKAASAYDGERQFYVNEYTPLSNKWAEASAAMEQGHAHREKGNNRRAFYFFAKAQTRYNKLNEYADRETYQQVAEQHAAASAEYKRSVGTKDEDEQKEAFNKGNEYIQRATKNLKTRKCDHCGGTFPVSEIHRTVTMDGLEKNLYCPDCYEKPATSKGAQAEEESETEQQQTQEVEAGGKTYEVAAKDKEEKKEKKGYFDDSEFLSGGLASSPATDEDEEEEDEPEEEEPEDEEDDGDEWEDWEDDWEDDDWGDDETDDAEEETKEETEEPEDKEPDEEEDEPKTTTTTRTRRVSRTARTRNVHREPVEVETEEPEDEEEEDEPEPEPETTTKTEEKDEKKTTEEEDEEETGRKRKQRATSQRQTKTSEDEPEEEDKKEEEPTSSSTGRSTKGRRGRSKSTPTQSAPTSQSSETKISDENTESEDEREVETGSKPDREYSKVGSVTTEWAIEVLELDGEPEDERELKTAFRKQMRDHHPDHGGNREDFKKVQDARERLQKFLKYSD